jgi:host factor-I protein
MAYRSPLSQHRSKAAPPDDTFKESEYLRGLGERQKIVAIKLTDGQMVRGWVEYFDRNMIRLTREGDPNLFIFKEKIAYIAEEKRPATLSAQRRP